MQSKSKIFFIVTVILIIVAVSFFYINPLNKTIGGKAIDLGANSEKVQIQADKVVSNDLCTSAKCSGVFRCDGQNSCRFRPELISSQYIVAPLGTDNAFMQSLCQKVTQPYVRWANGVCTGTGAICDFRDASVDCTQEVPAIANVQNDLSCSEAGVTIPYGSLTPDAVKICDVDNTLLTCDEAHNGERRGNYVCGMYEVRGEIEGYSWVDCSAERNPIYEGSFKSLCVQLPNSENYGWYVCDAAAQGSSVQSQGDTYVCDGTRYNFQPAAPAAVVPGDLNNDGCVNFDDMSQILPSLDYNCPSVGHLASQDRNRAGDLNHNGCVNFDDMSQILPNLDYACTPR
ncbi:hypothetical protein HYV86_00435 [Candidatus Woesearchaeota archaeon]|nr:hypothetical protein [Candidatus Woesearchaeota archaeon]